MLFQLGQVVMTCGIAARMGTDPSFARGVRSSLDRHATGDWGDVGEESRRMNDDALEAESNGEWSDSLFSLYDIEGWVGNQSCRPISSSLSTIPSSISCERISGSTDISPETI